MAENGNLNRRKEDERLCTMAADITLLKGWYAELKAELFAGRALTETNAKMVTEIKENTADLLLAFNVIKGSILTLHLVLSGVKWIGKNIILPLVLLYAFIYVLWHHGELPLWLKNAKEFLQ